MKLFIVLALAVASACAASLNTIPKFGFPEGRIINGQNTKKGDAPFMVSLQYFYQHFCGGSIISENWVLTAGHCVDIYEPISVVVGIHRLSDSSLAQTRVVTEQFRHENYTGGVGANDIGLLYFKKSLILNAWVAIINLSLNPLHDTGDGRVYGFGTDNSGQLSNKLQVLNVTISGFDDCNDFWPAPPLDLNTLCTSEPGTTDSACSGDSGGPLTRTNAIVDTVPTQVGIVSWGRLPCGQDSAPSVYTRVSAFVDWINEKINSNLIAAEDV